MLTDEPEPRPVLHFLVNHASPGRLTSLLVKAQAGDESAMESLLALIRPALLRYAASSLDSEPDHRDLAKDVVQDALLRMVKGLPDCMAQSDAQVIAWALTIVRNLCISYYRALRRHRSVRLEDDVFQSAAEMPPGHGSAEAPRAALLLLVRRVVSQLPTAARQLIELRFGQGASWSTLAAELGTTRCGAKRRFHRLRSRVARAIRDSAHRLPTELRNAVTSILDAPPP
jgi:RNA polymerase sigma factor (sigma-70 family)